MLIGRYSPKYHTLSSCIKLAPALALIPPQYQRESRAPQFARLSRREACQRSFRRKRTASTVRRSTLPRSGILLLPLL